MPVHSPVSLLRNDDLAPSDKLIWLISRLSPAPDPAWLQRRSGLSRPTVLKALAVISQVSAEGPTVPIPEALLTNRALGAQTRLLYGLLQLTPEQGQFTYASLAGLTGAGLNTVRRAVAELVRAGWLRTTQESQRAPVTFTLCDPLTARAEAEAQAADQRLAEADYRCEEIMKEYLNLLVDSNDFEDNARPGFLVNPLTGERMELDRYYQPGVAFEFNGPQHDGIETDFATAREAGMQRVRDLIKLGLCTERYLKVVTVRVEDLTLQTMQAKVGDLLPTRDLTGHEPLIALLEFLGGRAARRSRKPTDPRAPQPPGARPTPRRT